jgi:hypothetical protein
VRLVIPGADKLPSWVKIVPVPRTERFEPVRVIFSLKVTIALLAIVKLCSEVGREKALLKGVTAVELVEILTLSTINDPFV